jgi:hypothetical protein
MGTREAYHMAGNHDRDRRTSMRYNQMSTPNERFGRARCIYSSLNIAVPQSRFELKTSTSSSLSETHYSSHHIISPPSRSPHSPSPYPSTESSTSALPSRRVPSFPSFPSPILSHRPLPLITPRQPPSPSSQNHQKHCSNPTSCSTPICRPSKSMLSP